MRMVEDLLLALVTRHFRWCTALFIAAGIAAAAVADFRVSHSHDDWIDHDSPLYRTYRELADEFGDAETLLAVFAVDDITRERAGAYAEVVDKVRWMNGVTAVFDPLELLLGASAFDPPERYSIDYLRKSFRSKPPDFRNVVLSRDVTTAGVLVLLDPARRETHAAVLATLRAGFDALGIAYHLGGTVYFSATLKETLTADMTRVISVLVAAAMLLLWVFLRHFVLVLCVFAGIGVSLLGTIAGSSLAGQPLNLLTLILFPLVFCIGVTTSIHLFSRREHGRWSLEHAYRRVVTPALIAALTTAIGCTAFIGAPQATVARMGLILPAGILLTFLSMVVFVPSAFRCLTGGWRLPELHHHPLIPPARVRRAVGSVLIAATLAAAAVLPRIAINPDALYFFARDSTLMRSYRYIEDHLTGLLVVDMVIRATDGQPVTTGGHADRIKAFIATVRGHPALTTVVSGYDVMPFATATGADTTALGNAFFGRDRAATRISLRFRNVSDTSYAEIARTLRAGWRAAGAHGLQMQLTGLIPLILDAQHELLRIQSGVSAAVLLIISLVLLVFFRSFKLLVVALVVNFMPLVITAGAMVALAIPINSINLFVGSVMLGIVVDDTIHVLHAIRHTGAIETGLLEVGASIWITCVTVTVAFMALWFSDVVPIVQFGLLSVIAVTSAYLCEICLLPALLAWGSPRS